MDQFRNLVHKLNDARNYLSSLFHNFVLIARSGKVTSRLVWAGVHRTLDTRSTHPSFYDCTTENLWSRETISKNVPTFCKLAVQILTFTYCCESAFINMNFTKIKIRICMTNENLQPCLLLAITTMEQKFKYLAGSRKYHFSHQQNNKEPDNIC